MRFLFSLISFTLVTAVLGTTTVASEELHSFYGSVQSVDLVAKTLSIKSGGRTLVFHYNDQTQISSFNGHVSWDKIKGGQGAAVVMRLGEGNIGMALKVRFDLSTHAEKGYSLYVARTTDGRTISGVAVGNYVAYEPHGEAVYRATGFATNKSDNSAGVFVLSINPDGTVGKITAAKSLNSAEANESMAKWLRKWRFKPNSVTQVQMPVGMYRSW